MSRGAKPNVDFPVSPDVPLIFGYRSPGNIRSRAGPVFGKSGSSRISQSGLQLTAASSAFDLEERQPLPKSCFGSVTTLHDRLRLNHAVTRRSCWTMKLSTLHSYQVRAVWKSRSIFHKQSPKPPRLQASE